MPYIDIHNERVWIPERPLRSMDEARPMRDGDLWRCPACGRELDEEENDDGTITLVCPAHQVGWDAGHEDEPYPMGGLVFRLTMGGGVFIAGPCMAVCPGPHLRGERILRVGRDVRPDAHRGRAAVNAFKGRGGHSHCPACWARMFRSAPLDGGPATLVCLRCGLERPLEPVAGPPEPYTRAVRALDMLADALDEDVMP